MIRNAHVFRDLDSLFRQGAERVAAIGRQAIAERGAFHLALAGGETPRGLYRLLASDGGLEWERVHIYFGDERCVPPAHDDSNYRMAEESLLSQVPIPAGQVHRIQGELPPQEAATDYARLLEAKLPQAADGARRFDLVLLGMGPDGHIASLFPDTDILKKRKPTAAAVFVPKLESWRVSLTLPLINQARHIMVLISGYKKADVVRHLDAAGNETAPLPIQLLHPKGELEWYLDYDAARHLGQPPEE